MNNYNRVVIFCYPAGAGGKFLNNCLALSDEFVFSDSLLAQQQIDGQFNFDKKVQYIDQMLTHIKEQKIWNDLNLGCFQLSRVSEKMYRNEYHEIIKLHLHKVIDEIIHHNLWFGIVAHTIPGLTAMIKFWPNAKVIFLTNSLNLLLTRKYQNNKNLKHSELAEYWNIVRGASWPDYPPSTLEEFELLPDNIKQELNNNFSGEIFRFFDYNKLRYHLFELHAQQILSNSTGQCYNWNTDNNYANNEVFLQELYKCCQWLEIDNPPLVAINHYFNQWKSTIYQLSPGDEPA